MLRKSPSLDQIIAAEIAADGPLTFARFMELALYHPELGYYSSGRAGIGRAGDFYTNVSVGPTFGRVLAGQFQEMRRHLGEPKDFTVVEQGAHHGQFAADVLTALNDVHYAIIEPVGPQQDAQREHLAPFAGRVSWHESVDALPPFQGVHFSNELMDALPFHLVRSTGSGWEELRVNGGEFVPAPPSSEIETACLSLPIRPAGYITELRPAAARWIQTVANKLQRGFILAVDYGFTREELLAEHRTEGTFSCYKAHHRDAQPLLEPGEKDITAHVDFTALTEAAVAAGLQPAGWTDQHHFMVGAAEDLMRSLPSPPDAAAQKTLRALQTLLHPSTMGTQFYYLAFAKGVGGSLSGFRYARKR